MRSDAKAAPVHSLCPPRHAALRCVDLAATRHLTTGLPQCVPVLDHVLAALNEQTGIPEIKSGVSR